MTAGTELQDQDNPLLSAIVSTTLEPNNHELVRRLVKVLGINDNTEILLIADGQSHVQNVLSEFGANVTTYTGEIDRLPYTSQQFDSAVVIVPITRNLQHVAGELGRVLKANGCLGMIVFSVYRDQMPDDTTLSERANPLLASSRPTAVYRAVLAEAGFTAFVTEDRKRDVRRAALASYREHVLRPAHSVATQALGLMANGSVGVALITAEKGL